jgi:two-component system response regulator
MKTNYTVLLADDDNKDHSRFKAALQLASPSLTINSVYNGMELVDHLLLLSENKKSTLPDFIITDLDMPCAGGLQVLKRLRANEVLKKIPVYVFSANFDNTIRTKVIENGATEFYRKPGDAQELERIIFSIVERKTAEESSTQQRI